jgi:seryl-tRNA synthetase
MTLDDDIRVDVGVLKSQVSTLTTLCGKMDQVIEKLVDQHDRHLVKVYENIDARRKETDMDIKELHERIDVVLDKVQISEKTLLEEIQNLRKDMQEHNTKDRENIEKLLQWKWMIAGGILVISWLLSNVKFDILPLK